MRNVFMYTRKPFLIFWDTFPIPTVECFPFLKGNVSESKLEMFPSQLSKGKHCYISQGGQHFPTLLKNYPIPTRKYFPFSLENISHPYGEMFSIPIGKCFPFRPGNIFPFNQEIFLRYTGKCFLFPLGKVFLLGILSHLYQGTFSIPHSYWEMFPIIL